MTTKKRYFDKKTEPQKMSCTKTIEFFYLKQRKEKPFFNCVWLFFLSWSYFTNGQPFPSLVSKEKEYVRWYGEVQEKRKKHLRLESVEFCSSPVTSLGVVTDGVASAKTDPLGKRTVLFHLLGENALDSEGLVCTHCWLYYLNYLRKKWIYFFF